MKSIKVFILILTVITGMFGAGKAFAMPAITDVQISDITESSATISWTTDIPGDSEVSYGEDDLLGSSESDAGFVTDHSVISPICTSVIAGIAKAFPAPNIRFQTIVVFYFPI